MAISVVQATAPVRFGNATSAAPTITGVTAGNSILVATFGAAFDTGGTPSISVSDGTSYTSLAQIVDAPVSSHYQIVDISLLTNVTSGTHSVVSTNTAGVGECSGWAVSAEIAGLQNSSTLDVSSTATSASGNPATGATGAVASSNEIAIAVFSYRFTTVGTITGPGGSWINIASEPDGTNDAAIGSVDYLTPVPGGTQSASWNPPTGSNWCAAIVVLKGLLIPNSGVVGWIL